MTRLHVIGAAVLAGMALLMVWWLRAPAHRPRFPRAPHWEQFTGERLVIGPYKGTHDRMLVFPCAPVGQGCAASPLAADKVVFHGAADGWRGFQLCASERCVPFEQVFGR